MAAYRYWQHFLALESDFGATSRYVEFSKQNFAAFSIEYVKLLLAIRPAGQSQPAGGERHVIEQ